MAIPSHASNAVFKTPELVGMILEHLPILDLPKVRLVSQCLKSEANRVMARHLKWWSEPKKAESYMQWRPTPSKRWRPYITHDRDKQQVPMTYPIITWNPHIADYYKETDDVWKAETRSRFAVSNFVRHPSGPWRDTFLTQPPCNAVKLRWIISSCGISLYEKRLKNPNGVRLSDLSNGSPAAFRKRDEAHVCKRDRTAAKAKPIVSASVPPTSPPCTEKDSNGDIWLEIKSVQTEASTWVIQARTALPPDGNFDAWFESE